MNERDLIGNASMSSRKRKPKAPPLMEEFYGPSFKETLQSAPVLCDVRARFVSAPELLTEPERGDLGLPKRLSFEESAQLDKEENKRQRDWEKSLAARVRAGALSIETAISTASHYGERLGLHQWSRRW
jgi:hypothetical protein